ncbi:MAG: OsmC family protein [Bryobacteraceae bacterium]|nr:OsmC family protein [Bryobacteraceae bacterium]MDW8377835.1 OsmC family protein [Bryobacterales bacterium]
MNVVVKHENNVRFCAEARGHRVICDQPLSNNGEDQGMTPPELLLASLGTCAAYYAVEYLRTRGFSAEGLEVRVEAEKSPGPARLSQFRIQVSLPALDERHQQGVLRAIKSCLIHNTLLNAPAIDVALETTAVAAA